MPPEGPEVRLERRVDPRYPEEAKRKGIEASCRLRIFIDERGPPYDVEFVSCPPVFHDATRTAIMKWRWHPASDGAGQPVEGDLPARLELLHGFESFELDRPCVTVIGSARFDEVHPY